MNADSERHVPAAANVTGHRVTCNNAHPEYFNTAPCLPVIAQYHDQHQAGTRLHMCQLNLVNLRYYSSSIWLATAVSIKLWSGNMENWKLINLSNLWADQDVWKIIILVQILGEENIMLWEWCCSLIILKWTLNQYHVRLIKECSYLMDGRISIWIHFIMHAILTSWPGLSYHQLCASIKYSRYAR